MSNLPVSPRLLLLGLLLGLSSAVLPRSPPAFLKTTWASLHSFHQYRPHSDNHVHVPPELQFRPPVDALTPARAKAEKQPKDVSWGTKGAERRAPVYFVSHGGPEVLSQPDSAPFKTWQRIGREIEEFKPDGIVVVSAHWQGDSDTVYIAEGGNGELIGDTSSIPSNLLFRPPPPSPILSTLLHTTLVTSGLSPASLSRSLDSGVYVPFSAMFPPSRPLSIPLIQISLPSLTTRGKGSRTGQDIASELAKAVRLGEALGELRRERIVVVASGMSVDELPRGLANDPATQALVREFDDHIAGLVSHYTGTDRESHARAIALHPEYDLLHPTPEHIAPLLVAVGAAGDSEGEVLLRFAEGDRAWGTYRFGEVESGGEDVMNY